MKFKIYYCCAGLGLAKDAVILQNALHRLGYEAEVLNIPLSNESKFGRLEKLFVNLCRQFGLLFFFRKLQRLFWGNPKDVAIHLEKIFYWRLFSHQKHILIPNQEWFSSNLFPLLDYIDRVWVKTQFAKGIFKEFKSKVEYVGFSSGVGEPINRSQASRYFFSRVGISKLRGAERLVEAWRLHPEWPCLKIVIDSSAQPADPPANVEYVAPFPKVDDYIAFATGAQFHVYATEMEGFGHSIVESMAWGSIVLVTDAPPMNEVANAECALLIPAHYSGQKCFSPRFLVSLEGLERVVERALSLSSGEISFLSNAARERPVQLQSNFHEHLGLAIKNL